MAKEIKCELVGMLCGGGYDRMLDSGRRVYSDSGLSPTVTTCGGGDREPKIIQRPHGYSKGAELEECPSITTSAFQENNLVAEPKPFSGLRVRKLTPKECYRLMGVKDEDGAKIGKNLSRSMQYHTSGDSIVTTCLMAIFGEMLDIDYEAKINEVVKDITGETK